MRDMEPQFAIFFHQVKCTVQELANIQLSYWQPRSWEKSPNNLCCFQENRVLSTHLQHCPIVEENNRITHWTWRCQAGAYIESAPLHSCTFGMGTHCACYQQRNINITSATKVFVPVSKICMGNCDSMLLRVTHQNVWLNLRPILCNGAHI